MKKDLLLLTIVLTCAILVGSCALFREQLDKMSGFSSYLKETEIQIRMDDWQGAETSLNKAMQAWWRVKPYLQVDIDHDYDIETGFMQLRGYIATQTKADSLALIILLQDNWRNIGSM